MAAGYEILNDRNTHSISKVCECQNLTYYNHIRRVRVSVSLQDHILNRPPSPTLPRASIRGVTVVDSFFFRSLDAHQDETLVLHEYNKHKDRLIQLLKPNSIQSMTLTHLNKDFKIFVLVQYSALKLRDYHDYQTILFI
jgi:hypothetical protein